MLPATILPSIVSCAGETIDLAPSLQFYLQTLQGTSPFETLPHPFPVLSFVEALYSMDLKAARVRHTCDASRHALALLQKSATECTDNATHILSSLPLYDTVCLLSAQATGGSLITFIRDITTLAETQLIYLLCAFYTNVRITKLVVSHTRAERALICTGFKSYVSVPPPPYTFQLPMYFRTRLEEINSMNGQMRFDLFRCAQKTKCQEWLDMHITPAKTPPNDAVDAC